MLPRKLKLFVALTAMIALFAVTVPTIPFIVNIASGVSPTGIVVTEEEAVISTYESLLPSVVSILITERVSNDLGEVSLQETGGGTGFFISADGYIITNKHVVLQKNVTYTVITNTGKEYVGSVLARDPLFDIAILKVEGSGFKPAKLGDSDKIRIGQTVIAVGNVLTEFQNSVTRGIVSGVGRTITASGSNLTETIEGAIQTDASINPGNSGGPLVNLKGEVIGINTAIDRSGEALGFAIPVNVAKNALEKFRKHGKITRTLLGVRYIMLNRYLSFANKLPVREGAYVMKEVSSGEPTIIPGGPAEKAGIKPGDVILEVNGAKLSATRSLSTAISKYEPGAVITLKILRGGTEISLKATLGERTAEE
ncbi:MAG: trypsin-like peptidase domain-containing protein [Candidatus Veblenbacteria bacterium]|nr:trypsin-like peptidase domain-containing protein [Candidatus Veblenbacteria bacterium]